jgi:hypothetical protein
MRTNTDPVQAAIRKLSDQLRLRQEAALAEPSTPAWKRAMIAASLQDEAREREAQPKRTRKRKPTLASVARQAAKAGVEVARYVFRPDGTIGVVTGKPDAITNLDGPNEWDTVQ